MIEHIHHQVLPVALGLLPERMTSPEAKAMSLAIGLQESRFVHRIQVTSTSKVTLGLIRGPARGFWQFERAGGVRGVLRHPASQDMAALACRILAYPAEEHRVWEAIADNDTLACIFARLLLWTHPKSLPAEGETNIAWEYYLNLWRPGKPHRSTWADNYNQAWSLI